MEIIDWLSANDETQVMSSDTITIIVCVFAKSIVKVHHQWNVVLAATSFLSSFFFKLFSLSPIDELLFD